MLVDPTKIQLFCNINILLKLTVTYNLWIFQFNIFWEILSVKLQYVTSIDCLQWRWSRRVIGHVDYLNVITGSNCEKK